MDRVNLTGPREPVGRQGSSGRFLLEGRQNGASRCIFFAWINQRFRVINLTTEQTKALEVKPTAWSNCI